MAKSDLMEPGVLALLLAQEALTRLRKATKGGRALTLEELSDLQAVKWATVVVLEWAKADMRDAEISSFMRITMKLIDGLEDELLDAPVGAPAEGLTDAEIKRLFRGDPEGE